MASTVQGYVTSYPPLLTTNTGMMSAEADCLLAFTTRMQPREIETLYLRQTGDTFATIRVGALEKREGMRKEPHKGRPFASPSP